MGRALRNNSLGHLTSRIKSGRFLRSGPWGKFAREVKDLKPDAAGELNLTHSVWRRDVLSATAVTLGPPGIPGKGYPYAMYGVAVKALE